MTKSQPLVELHRCSIVLDDHVVLDDVSFQLRAGERWALIGANGSGKTMLLKLIRGDMWPTPTGRERRAYRLGTARDAGNSKQQIAYVGSERQDKYVRYDWDLTVNQVVTTGLFDEDIPLTQPNSRQREKVDRMLKRFGIWRLRTRKFLTLSYGQRRLTLIARAFVSRAQVLLLDEVFNGLDAKAKAHLRSALESPREAHAWIITSHRPQELPANVTHLAHLEAGKLVSAGPAKSNTKRRTPSAVKVVANDSPPIAATRTVRSRWLVRITNSDLFRDYRRVIRDLNWEIRTGEHWAVLGANGSGKSSLLNLIYGDMHPALGGTIERRGAPHGTPISEWKRRVGWVSPELQADHYLASSIEEIVVSGRYSSVGLNQPITATDRKVATQWLRFFGIESLRERGPRQVSYGQMRLALIARAMVNDPELLLLDEPCTGLDGDVREHVLQVLQRIALQGTQLLMAVHDASDIVPAIEHVLRIGRGGRVVAARRR